MGSRGIALLFHDHGTRRGWGVSLTPRPLFTPGKYPVSTVQEGGWSSGPVWTGTENLARTGIRSQTVQLVVSRYTDWPTRPTSHNITQVKWNNARAKPALHGSPDSPVRSLHSRVSVDPWVPSSPALHPHTTSALPATVILWNHVTVYWVSVSLWTRQRK